MLLQIKVSLVNLKCKFQVKSTWNVVLTNNLVIQGSYSIAKF